MQAVSANKSNKINQHTEKEQEIQKVDLLCENCTNESLFDVEELTDYLLNNIKVKRKTGQLGKNITVQANGSTITVEYKKFFQFNI